MIATRLVFSRQIWRAAIFSPGPAACSRFDSPPLDSHGVFLRRLCVTWLLIVSAYILRVLNSLLLFLNSFPYF